MTNPTDQDVAALVARRAREARDLTRVNWAASQSAVVQWLTEAATALSTLAAEVERVKSDREYVIGWNDGFDHVHGPLRFPTMLRKMWSGGEVQAWLDAQRIEAARLAAADEGSALLASEARATALEAQLARAREERDVWKSKSGMHQRAATGFCTLQAQIVQLADKWERYSKNPDDGQGYAGYAEGHAACAAELRALPAPADGRGDQMLASARLRPEPSIVEDLHGYCGSDAARWAEQFRLMAIKLGYSDMDEGWLIGWFANAIERSIQVRHPPALPDYLADAKSKDLPSEARADGVKVAVAAERERCALIVDDECPATQDMESTMICDALERAASRIRSALTAPDHGDVGDG
jgi:hypothetical protein